MKRKVTSGGRKTEKKTKTSDLVPWDTVEPKLWGEIAILCILSYNRGFVGYVLGNEFHISVHQAKQIRQFASVCKNWNNMSLDLHYLLAAHYRSGLELSAENLMMPHFTELPRAIMPCSDCPPGQLIFRLTSLTTLNLLTMPHGALKETRQMLRFLTNLRSLRLTVTDGFNEPLIDHLTNLTKLETKDAFFFSYPPHPNVITSLKSLTVGEICDREIKESKLVPFTALTSLTLKTLTITAKFVNSLNNLTKLDLGCSKIKPKELKEMPNLLSLGTRHQIRSSHVRHFPNITSLKISYNLADCDLKGFLKLRRLDAPRIPTSSGGAENIEELVLREVQNSVKGDVFDFSKLTSLVLINCGFSLKKSLDTILTRYTGLKSFKIQNMSATPELCEKLNQVVPLTLKNVFCTYGGGHVLVDNDPAGGFSVFHMGDESEECDPNESEEGNDPNDYFY